MVPGSCPQSYSNCLNTTKSLFDTRREYIHSADKNVCELMRKKPTMDSSHNDKLSQQHWVCCDIFIRWLLMMRRFCHSIILYIYCSICLSICPSINLLYYHSIYLSFFLFVCHSMYLLICLSFNPLIYILLYRYRYIE